MNDTRREIVEYNKRYQTFRAKVEALSALVARAKELKEKGLPIDYLIQQIEIIDAESVEAEVELEGQLEALEQLRSWLLKDIAYLEVDALPTFAREADATDSAKPVTRWLRVNEYKYRSRRAAVEAYVAIHGGDFKTLYYSHLGEDRKKGLIGDRLKLVRSQKSKSAIKKQG